MTQKGIIDKNCPICHGHGMAPTIGSSPLSVRRKCPCVEVPIHLEPLNPGCPMCQGGGAIIYNEPIIGPSHKLCACILTPKERIPPAPPETLGKPSANCMICKGMGTYKLSAYRPELKCPCLPLSHMLKMPYVHCEMCSGDGYITFRVKGGDTTRKHCACTTYREPKTVGTPSTTRKKPRPAKDNEWGALEKEIEDKRLEHSDANTDYSHWPGPHMTSFILDIKNDKDGKGNWVVMSRDDDSRTQRLYVESIEQTEDPYSPGRYTFTVVARDQSQIW